MGQPITVDSDDLEALLFATGSIKAIEAALQQRSRDPLVKRAEPVLTEAHNRLAKEWRNATREEPSFAELKPLTDEDFRLLDVGVAHPLDRLGYPVSAPMPMFDRLRAHGMVVLSPDLAGRAWGGGDIGWVDSGRMTVRMTERGHKALLAWKEQAAAGIAAGPK